MKLGCWRGLVCRVRIWLEARVAWLAVSGKGCDFLVPDSLTPFKRRRDEEVVMWKTAAWQSSGIQTGSESANPTATAKAHPVVVTVHASNLTKAAIVHFAFHRIDAVSVRL